jgi:hypothetical protein
MLTGSAAWSCATSGSGPGSGSTSTSSRQGRIPDGGSHRAHGRATAARGLGIGYDYLHSAVDDRSRVAFSQVLPEESAVTAALFLVEAASFFADHGCRSSGS